MKRISKIRAAVASATAAGLLLAAPAQAETAWWRGEYMQGGRSTSLDAILTIEGDRLEGRFMEPNPGPMRQYPYFFSTVVNGQVRLGQVRFGKAYDGLGGLVGEILYTGTINNGLGVIEGEWRSGPSRGAFVLRKIPTPPLAASMPNTTGVVAKLESAMANQIARAFSALYWSYGPAVPASFTAQISPETTSLRNVRRAVSEALDLNRPRLNQHVARLCRQLTFDQRRVLRSIAQERMQRLLPQLASRRENISRALGRPVSAVSADVVPLRFSDTCGAAANSGDPSQARDEIVVADDLLLSAAFSAMLVDSLGLVMPDRAGASIGALRFERPDPFDLRVASDAFFRLRATPLWASAIRNWRFVGGDQSSPQLGERQFYAAVCARDRSLPCWLGHTITLAMTSSERIEVLLGDQFDFVLAHELGHYALRHFSPKGDCAAEAPLERDADLFAVALLRSPTGFFSEARTNLAAGQLDNTIQSGVELLMTQNYSGFREGGCQYPPFAERIAAAKAFEARAFPMPR